MQTLVAEEVDAGRSPDVPARTTMPVVGAACASAAAAVVHLALVPSHAAAWLAEGVAFGLVGTAQLGLALALLVRPTRRAALALAGVSGMAAATLAWAAWIGLPFGPHGGEAHGWDTVSLLTVAVELVAVTLAVAAVRRGDAAGSSVRPAGFALGAVAGSIGLMAVFMALPVAAHSHTHGHGEGEGEVEGGSGGHDHGPSMVGETASADMSMEDRARLAEELVVARELALKYPTVADALDAGLYRAGPYAPGAGAHYIVPENEMTFVTGFDLNRPLSYLYSGTKPESKVVGIMYYVGGDTPPEGFTGPADEWHRHDGVCLTVGGDGGLDSPLPVDGDTTKAMCDEVGGEWMDQTAWMAHVWVVPGWESAQGVFSHDHPDLVCADGRAELDVLNLGCEGR